MHFDRFLARCRAEWPSFDDPASLARTLHPRSRDLTDVLSLIEGMATENKLMLLNAAAASLDPGEVYVEIGCYRGASIVGAARRNPHLRIFACDNFSQFDGAADALRANLARYAPDADVQFFDLDFRRFLALAPWQPARIGACFYDGRHYFADHYDALALVLPHLARDALVIIDDSNHRAVRAANALFARKVEAFTPILDLRTPANKSPTWWNGVQVWRFTRNPSAPQPPLDSLYSLDVTLRRLYYDTLIRGTRRKLRALRRLPRRTLKRLRHRRA
jgi:predicted O-methyltransferase YrrM